MIIYVCSPLRGTPPYTATKYRKNLEAAAEYCRAVADEGHIPIAPHLYFEKFLDDQNPDDRKKGMDMGNDLLRICKEVWVFSDNGISEGMTAEIKMADEMGKPIRYR